MLFGIIHTSKRKKGGMDRIGDASAEHLKSEYRLARNRLKGTAGNEINAILAAAAMNFQKLLRGFWRISLFRMIDLWNGMLTLQGQQARDTQLQPA